MGKGAGSAGGGGGAGGRGWKMNFYATHRFKLFLVWLLALIATPPIIVYVFNSHPIAMVIGGAVPVLAGVRLSIWEVELARKKRQTS